MIIQIDGSQGEGGGQVLRSALALSALTSQPVKIKNIRGKRKRPGLLRQHLTCVKAAQAICGATVEGAALKSSELTFRPQQVQAGDYHFAIGTAGSTMLVLQTILPLLMLADGPSSVILEGGTHNGMSPSFDYINQVFLPLLTRMGPQISCELERWGFYPAGGGRLKVKINPVSQLQGMTCDERGDVLARKATAIIADLPGSIAQKELEAVRQRLNWTEYECGMLQVPQGQGPGNCLNLLTTCENVTELAVSYGNADKRVATVVAEACDIHQAWLKADVFAGEYLADQLLLPFALAGSGSFTTIQPSLHATTNLNIINLFLGTEHSFEQLGEEQYRADFGFLKTAAVALDQADDVLFDDDFGVLI